MTYKTRQEVLRTAADWMDVCEAAGVEPICKFLGDKIDLFGSDLNNTPWEYEFPLALLEGKEVWVGSEVCDEFGRFVHAEEFNGLNLKADGRWYNLKSYSWNPPKPKIVLVPLLVEDAKNLANKFVFSNSFNRVSEDCKKALDKL